jgi:hypothetical protein
LAVIVGLVLAALSALYGHRPMVRRGGWTLVLLTTVWFMMSGGMEHVIPVFDRAAPVMGDSVWHVGMLFER